MKKIIVLLIYFIVATAISFSLINFKLIDYSGFIKFDFLFTFIGVLIGFALTLFTYITSMFDKLKDKIKAKYSGDERSEKLKLLNTLYDEIKDDINFLFYSLLIVAIAFMFYGRLTDYIEIVNSVLMAIFLLSLLSIKDLISVSLNVSKFIILD